MANIKLRNTEPNDFGDIPADSSNKQAPLTNKEVDANFISLNRDKLDRINNLSELTNLVDARDNLELGANNNVTFTDLTANGNNIDLSTVDIESGETKTINIGTNGKTGSTTNVNIGSSETGALGKVTIDSEELSVENDLVVKEDLTGKTATFSERISAEDASLEDNLFIGGASTQTWISDKEEDIETHAAIAVGNRAGPYHFTVVNKSDDTKAYAEFLTVNDEGDSESGWCSFGINSSNYNDPEFLVTKADDGYLLFEAPDGSDNSGDLIIGTGENGTGNRIIFTAAGFTDPENNRQLVITPGVSVKIDIDTESSSVSTGALVVDGGIGLQGNLNIGGNVNITGSITIGGEGSEIELESLQVAGSIIFVGDENPSDGLDIGIVGEFTDGGSVKRYTGIVRDSSDGGKYKIFTNANDANQTNISSGDVNFSDSDIQFPTLQIGSLEVTDNTASTTTTSGAVKVAGGLGIVGRANIGGRTIISDNTASTSSSSGALTVTGGAGIDGSLFVGGNVTAIDFDSTSDAQLKENVYTIEDALSIVSELRGVRFDWKESKKESIGVIAQEVEHYVPEVVSTNSETGYKSVSYGNLVGLLIEAVKELKSEIDQLKNNNNNNNKA